MAKFRKMVTRSKRTKSIKRNRLKKTLRSKKNRSINQVGANGNNVTIVLLWMEGCSHCILLNKSWLILKEKFKNVKFIDMESRNIDYELLKKYNIESPRGFPTLIKIKNGVNCGEPNSRNIDDLIKWVNS